MSLFHLCAVLSHENRSANVSQEKVTNIYCKAISNHLTTGFYPSEIVELQTQKDPRGEMICVKTEYFNINRILLLILGVWPYHQTIFTKFQQISLLSVLISFSLVMIVELITTAYTLTKFIESLSLTLFFIIYTIHNHSLCSNIQNVKFFMEELQCICNELRDENEIAIIKKYGNLAKRCITVITLLGLSILFALLSLPFWPYVFLPANESQSYISLNTIKTYVNGSEKYLYLFLLHMNLAFSIGTFSICAASTIILAYFVYSCAMFKIARSCEFIMSTFKTSFFWYIAIGIICLSINLFQIFRLVSSESDMSSLIIHIAFVSAIYIYIFSGNYLGQEVIRHSNDIYFTAYNVQWYMAPLKIQKMVLFLLQRGSKEYHLIIGGIFIASMELCATMVSTSISYFTVMYSAQQ